MMQLYSGTTCPFSHRCRFVLYEKGMDFQVIDVDLFNKPEDIAVMNENYVHLPMPEGAREGILKGMYLLRAANDAEVQLLGSGTILRECLAAADELERTHGIAANVWSVTRNNFV